MSVIRLQQIIRTEAPAKLLSQVAPIRPIQIQFQQFSQRAYTVYTSYARINDSPYKALTRTSLRFDLYSDELLDKSKLTTPKDAFVVVVLGSNAV